MGSRYPNPNISGPPSGGSGYAMPAAAQPGAPQMMMMNPQQVTGLQHQPQPMQAGYGAMGMGVPPQQQQIPPQQPQQPYQPYHPQAYGAPQPLLQPQMMQPGMGGATVSAPYGVPAAAGGMTGQLPIDQFARMSVAPQQPMGGAMPNAGPYAPQPQPGLGPTPPGLATYPPQMQMQQQQPAGAVPAQVSAASTDDPRFLPRPLMDSASIEARLCEGESTSTISPSSSSLMGGAGAGGFVGDQGTNARHITVACSPERFVPCSPLHLRTSCHAFPNSSQLARKYALPLGCVLQPLANGPGDSHAIPVVNFGPAGIVRCRRCRSYINYMCAFTDGGRRWRCSLCQFLNDIPNEYFCPLDASGRRRDADERPELSRGTVEFVAPAEYMVRPPMRPVYVFVLDATAGALSSGAFATVVSAIKASLDHLPNESARTQVGVICYDSAVHFYTLKPDGGEPGCVIVPDIADIFLPTPEDVLVNLSECRESLEMLLDRLPQIHSPSGASHPAAAMPYSRGKGGGVSFGGANAFGAAIKGASMLLEHNGGKLVCLLTSRPSAGPGSVKDREDNSVLGTDRERPMLQAADPHYKQLGVDLARFQISADLFLCPPAPGGYIDVATIAPLAKHSGGDLQLFSAYQHARDMPFLFEAICRNLSRETGFEAVMRIRASRGVRCTGFQGRFFLRSTDLMALPAVDEDKAFGVRFAFDETSLTQSTFVLQNALLYTTSRGERRIRVNTVAYPVVSSLSDLLCYIDSAATANLMMRTTVEGVRDRGLKEAESATLESLVSSLAAYRQLCLSQYGGSSFAAGTQLLLPDSMRLLPLYVQGIFKARSVSRDSAGAFALRLDDKAFLIHETEVLGTAVTTNMCYPLVLPLIPLPEESLTSPSDDGEGLVFPPSAPASIGSLKTESVVLVDAGTRLFVWIGAAAAQLFVSQADSDAAQQGDVLALASSLMNGAAQRASPPSDFDRVRDIVCAVRSARGGYGPPLTVVIQGGPGQAMVESLMTEDRSAQRWGYREFLSDVQKKVSAKAAKA
ncbi:Protein transport protein Sec24-like [Porphyridium purpureum]|uniref:Protein transport protein Sec24-like n=1 Tax=Porphyridium purpureum TaxID=35688 RepID=A0A5J4Z9C7_PORPP|nr:Protein transport protein Sec24-like [Porphyridium purpureum]|eukprot:POR9037..scf295_1